MEKLANQTYTTLIRDMPQGERPRERLVQYGPNALSNAELIAILLRTGVKGESVVAMSNRILSQFDGLARMGQVSFGELCSLNGVSEAKACQLLAAFELGRRLSSLSLEGRPVISSPRDVMHLLGADMSFLDQEHLRVLLLSTKSEVVSVHEIYKGTVNMASVRVAEVLRPAIRENTPSFIIVHNHPSGDPAPSNQDIMVTRQIGQAAEMMDIELLDHVIIGGQACLSMKNKGLGFRTP